MGGSETFHPPSFRQLGLGLIVGAIVFVGFLYSVSALPFIASFLTAPLLFIPDQLGLVDNVTKDDIITINVPVEHKLELPQAGKYIIYSTELLPAKDRVLLKSQETNRQIETSIILDGVNAYEGEFVKGQPIFEFEIEQAGGYEFYLQNVPNDSGATLYVIPDNSTQNQTVLMASCLLHMLVIGLIGRQIYYWRNEQRLLEEKKEKDKKREKFEEWMQKGKT
ncbi:MAG: hypothetical protein GY931_20230 [Maribacter sp.]|nr:hypothetical protein [Maribacter sp.]